MAIVLNILIGFAACLGVAVLFSLAVFIHELGHFLAARWLGLKIDVFSIGFGPAIWKKKIDGIEYKFCWIPFGGYVALPQLDPSGMEKVQGSGEEGALSERHLPDVAPWKRMIVSVAGPFGNVVLAMLLAAVIALWPGEFMQATSTIVGDVEKESGAYGAGLRKGDRIVAVNGHNVNSWYDMQVEFQLSGSSGSADFRVVGEGGVDKTMTLSFSTNNIMGMRVLDGVYPDGQSIVGRIEADSPARKAGIQVGDVFLSLNGTPVNGVSHFIKMLFQNGGDPVEIVVLRKGKRFPVTVTPEFSQQYQRHLIGIEFASAQVEVKPWMMHKSFVVQLRWDCMAVMRVLNALVAPKSKGERKAVAQNIGGPVMILTMFYDSVRSDFLESLGLLRMICINLAILNLLPLPVLDGGHVCFALYEVVTRRKPHPKIVAGLVNGLAIILIGLMAFLRFRDVKNRIKLNKLSRQLDAEEARISE